MKKIMLYNTKQNHPAIWPNMMSLAEGFHKCGRETVLCNLDDLESLQAGYRLLLDPQQVYFTIGMNNLGMYLPTPEGELFPVYHELDIPHVSVMLDMPYNHCISGFDVPCKNHIVTLLDPFLNDYLTHVYPDKQMHTLFLPLGGSSELDASSVFSSKRIYDVVVSASWWGSEKIERSWHTESLNQGITGILDDVADYLEMYPVNTMAAFREILSQRGLMDKEYWQKLIPFFEWMQRYIKPYRRLKSVEFLVQSGIPVDVFGAGWENAPFANHLNLHGGVSYEETLKIFSQARIVYQDQAEFNHGAHDRVFTAMLNGAVVVSEYSTYLDKEFIDGQDLFMFDWKHGQEQVGIIPELLSDEPRRLAIAFNAYSKADKKHRWVNRAQRILEAVNILYPEAK